MKQLIQKGKAGSALVEVVLAIAILGLVSAPICSTLMVAARINAQSRAVMKAQTQVSSAVERLMAEGIEAGDTAEFSKPDYPGVTLQRTKVESAYCEITVTSADDLVSVNTAVKIKPAGEPGEPGETPAGGEGGGS